MMRPWLALPIVVILGAVALAWLLPWSAKHPFLVPPELHVRANPQHDYKSPGILALTPVVVGVIVVTVCAGIYFCLVDDVSNGRVPGAEHRQSDVPRRRQRP